MGKGNFLKSIATRNKAKRRRRCQEKIPYNTQEEAEIAAKHTGFDLITYRCEFGNHFHVAHRARRPVVFGRHKRS